MDTGVDCVGVTTFAQISESLPVCSAEPLGSTSRLLLVVVLCWHNSLKWVEWTFYLFIFYITGCILVSPFVHESFLQCSDLKDAAKFHQNRILTTKVSLGVRCQFQRPAHWDGSLPHNLTFVFYLQRQLNCIAYKLKIQSVESAECQTAVHAQVWGCWPSLVGLEVADLHLLTFPNPSPSLWAIQARAYSMMILSWLVNCHI